MSSTACALYARISRDIAGEGLGVQRQLEDCRKKAEAMGWSVAHEYVDNDLSASKDVARPEYEAMVQGIQNGTVKALVVYDLDRLTRKPAELESFIDLSDKHGVSLANVSGDVDLTNANGRMIARIKGAVARQEAERIGERTSRAAKQRAESGIPQKGRYRLFGYTRDWAVDPAEKQVIVECFERRAAGESTTSIASDLMKRGIKTVAGKDWKSGTLGVTLTKPIYCGLREYKGQIIGDSAVPALVDKALFDAAQSNLANDKKGTNTRKYLLSGILLCSHCLAPMKGNPSNHMYRCSTTYGGCGRLSVRIALADQNIFHAAFSRYAMRVGNAKVGGKTRDYQSEIEVIEAEIKRIQQGFQAGLYELKEASPLIKEKRTVLKELEKQAAINRPGMPKIQRQYLDWYKMNLSQKRVFIGEHITSVVVYPSISRGNQPFDPGRLECHYPDGTKERLEREYEWDPQDGQ